MKRVFIIHGWGDSPSDHWIPWLKKELEKRGFDVEAPAMPDTDEPKIEKWIPYLNGVVGKADEETYYVGHSVGCQTILRHLEQLPADSKVGGAVFVAPWLTLTSLSSVESEAIAKPWLETPIDFEAAKSHLPLLSAFFSDNDPWVTLDNQSLFEQRLGAKTTVLHDKMHLGSDSGLTTFPELLKIIQEWETKS